MKEQTYDKTTQHGLATLNLYFLRLTEVIPKNDYWVFWIFKVKYNFLDAGSVEGDL